MKKREAFLEHHSLSSDVLKRIQQLEKAVENMIIHGKRAYEVDVTYYPALMYFDIYTGYAEDGAVYYREFPDLGITYNNKEAWSIYGGLQFALSEYYAAIIIKAAMYIDSLIPWPDDLKINNIDSPYQFDDNLNPKKIFIFHADFQTAGAIVFDLETGKLIEQYSARSGIDDSNMREEVKDMYHKYKSEGVVLISDYQNWAKKLFETECKNWLNLSNYAVGSYFTSIISQIDPMTSSVLAETID